MTFALIKLILLFFLIKDMLKISSSLMRQVNNAVFEEAVKKKALTKKVRKT